MIKQKHILLLALIGAIPLTIAWSFNHINPWVAFGIGLAIVLIINQAIKDNNENKN